MLNYRSILTTSLIPASVLGCFFLTPRASSGAIVEIAVSGRIGVDDSRTLLPDEIQSGEPWSGLIRYNTDLPDSDPDPKHASYSSASRPDALSISVIVHGYEFAGGFGDLSADVLNDIVHDPNQVFNPPPGDSFGIGGPMRLSPRLLDHSSIFFSWYDPTGHALSSEALPTAFDPFEFVQAGTGTGLPTFSPIYIRIEDIGLSTPTSTIRYTIAASIETAELRVIPEPPAITLSILAIVTLICWLLARYPFWNQSS